MQNVLNILEFVCGVFTNSNEYYKYPFLRNGMNSLSIYRALLAYIPGNLECLKCLFRLKCTYKPQVQGKQLVD